MSLLNRRRLLTLGGTAAAGLLTLRAGTSWSQQQPIRIGLIQGLSGPAGLFARDTILGSQMAVDKMNAEGGLLGRPVELVVRDDRGSLNEALSLFRQMSAEGIKLFVGPTGGAQFYTAVIPLLAEEGAVLSSTSTEMPHTHEMYTPNHFRMLSNAWQWRYGGGKLLAQRHPEVTKWTAILADLAVARTSWEYFKTGLTEEHAKKGSKVEFIEPAVAKFGATDFRNQLGQIVNSPAEGLFLGNFGADVVTFLQQGQGFNLDDKIKAFYDLGTHVEIAKALKKSTPHNLYGVLSWWPTGYDNPTATWFATEYKKRAPDGIVGSTPVNAFTIAASYGEAIKAAQSTEVAKVIAALESMAIGNTPYGTFNYRKEDHQSLIDVGFVKLDPAETEQGWSAEFIRQPAADLIEPATPGKPFVPPSK